MAAGNTYTPIVTNTLSSATSSVTFSSISGSYTDLVLVIAYKAATTNYPTLRLSFNGSATRQDGFVWINGGRNQTTTSYDGLKFFVASGNITGSVSVYGYNK
jgi:hypothetical protein